MIMKVSIWNVETVRTVRNLLTDAARTLGQLRQLETNEDGGKLVAELASIESELDSLRARLFELQ